MSPGHCFLGFLQYLSHMKDKPSVLTAYIYIYIYIQAGLFYSNGRHSKAMHEKGNKNSSHVPGFLSSCLGQLDGDEDVCWL